ncbi:oligosaccharide flippase family protein [Marinomonas sp. 5E14-1]|uniref:lipopolysaccharide biosynthesis protein n=1 Tax=Marinomonas sp. 5E14-1 TaxID=3153922 RepID=UPI0032660172
MTLKKILLFSIGPIGIALISLISLPIITWFYTIEDVGKISMLQVVVSFSVLLFCLGLDQAYVREYHEAKSKPKLFKTVFLPGFLSLSTVIIVLYFIDEMFISYWLYDEENYYLTIISSICIILAFCSRFLSLILRMEERALAYSMSQLLPKLFFVLFILLSICFGLIKDFYNLITANAISISIVFLVFIWNTRAELIESVTIPISKVELTSLLQYGFPLVVGGLASWGLNVMDKLFLRSFSTFSELGVYSVAASVAGVASIVSSVFNVIWAPLVFKWVKEGVDLKRINEVSEHLLAVIYFIVVLSGLFSWVLPYLLPIEYNSVQYFVTVCLLGPLFYTLSETTSIGISISRRSVFSMLASLGAVIINMIGNYFLVPKYGAEGAAVSTGLSFWCFYVLRTELACKAWRPIPRLRSYVLISVLLLFSILNAFFLRGDFSAISIAFILFIIGLFAFKRSIVLIFNLLKKNTCSGD